MDRFVDELLFDFSQDNITKEEAQEIIARKPLPRKLYDNRDGRIKIGVIDNRSYLLRNDRR